MTNHPPLCQRSQQRQQCLQADEVHGAQASAAAAAAREGSSTQQACQVLKQVAAAQQQATQEAYMHIIGTLYVGGDVASVQRWLLTLMTVNETLMTVNEQVAHVSVAAFNVSSRCHHSAPYRPGSNHTAAHPSTAVSVNSRAATAAAGAHLRSSLQSHDRNTACMKPGQRVRSSKPSSAASCCSGDAASLPAAPHTTQQNTARWLQGCAQLQPLVDGWAGHCPAACYNKAHPSCTMADTDNHPRLSPQAHKHTSTQASCI